MRQPRPKLGKEAPHEDAAHSKQVLTRALLERTFDDCPAEVLDRFQRAGTLQNHAAGERVVRKGAPSKCFLLVIEGEMEISITYASGHRHLFGFLTQGDCTGILFLTDGGDHLVDHTARVPTKLLAIPNHVVLKEMQDHASIALAMLRQLTRRTRISYTRVTLDPGVPLITRLAWALQTMATLYGLPRGERIVLNLKLSQGDIADWLGISRQHLNPLLKQLEKDGIICLARSSVTILNQPLLAKFAAG